MNRKFSTLYRSWSQHSPDWIPARLRRYVRRMTGGDAASAQLLRRLAWDYRYFVLLSLGASVFSAAFEGGTMAIFTLALEFAGGETTAFESIDLLNRLVTPIHNRYGENFIFPLLILIAVLMQLGRSWLDYASRVAGAYLMAWVEGDLRRRIFSQLMGFSYGQIGRYKVGNLASYMAEVERVGLMTNVFVLFIGHLTITLAYSIVLFWLSWQMTLGAVLGLLLLSVSLQRIRTRILFVARQFVASYANLNTQIVEYLHGMRLIHTFARYDFAKARVETIITEGVHARRRGHTMSAVIPALTQSITVMGVSIFLVAGYIYVLQTGQIDIIPRLVTFVFILYRLLPRVTGLNSTLSSIFREMPSIERIAKLLDTRDKQYLADGTHSFTSIQTGIQFENVVLRYDETNQAALNGISFDVPVGTFVAIVGSSGSGKSSIINLLLRLNELTAGTILVDQQALQTLKRRDWLQQVGIVDQDVFMLHASVEENIRFGNLDASHADIVAAAKAARAHEFVENLADGYQTVIGDRGQRLSGGQRQRIAIARAIVRQPNLLIFDEATSALDSESERLIQESIEGLRRQRTIIVVAHRLSTIREADQILVLKDGRLYERGTHTELLNRNSLYTMMWQMQTATSDS